MEGQEKPDTPVKIAADDMALLRALSRVSGESQKAVVGKALREYAGNHNIELHALAQLTATEAVELARSLGPAGDAYLSTLRDELAKHEPTGD